MEHRWGQRVLLDVPVRLLAEPRTPAVGRMVNASISGAFVRTADRLPLWVKIQVEMVLPRMPGHKGECVSALVTRRVRDGVGIEWCDLAPVPMRELLATAHTSAAMSDTGGLESTHSAEADMMALTAPRLVSHCTPMNP